MKTVKIFTIAILLLGYVSQSFSSLLVTPTRITFDARDRVAEVTLVNTSNEIRQYKLEWIEKKQNENNQYSNLTEAEIAEFAVASPYIRFSPRRVTLKPGESQKVKLLARRRADMKLPEYRSHLRFTALPPALTNATEDEQTSGIQLKLNLLLSYTIPVVLRAQPTNVDVGIESIKFDSVNATNKKGDATVVVTRKGNSSAYGNLILLHRIAKTDAFEPVGYTNGVNIFHEQSRNTLVIPWTEKPYTPAGEIKVVFEGTKEMSGLFYVEKILPLF